MDSTAVNLYFFLLILLIIFSGFFSGSETGMMALNRYRLKHLAKSGNKTARLVKSLLDRPDRLIGVILIGNNFVNNFAATLATLIAIHYFGNSGVAIAPVVLTIVVLIFAEVTPKTLAAYHPEKIAYPAAYILKPLLWLLMPLVATVGWISNGILKLAGVTASSSSEDHLSPEELRTVVNEAGGLIPKRHQKMLLNILDLESVTVNDIMVPRNEVIGIDIDDDINDILEQLRSCQHTRMPVYKGDINNIIGMFHTRKIARLLELETINKAELMQLTIEPYFVPEGTPLHTQLINFQKAKRRIGFIVDEYGDVQGIVTLEDILEEIVGEFTTDASMTSPDIHPQEDGSFIIDGSATIRDINRTLNWHLPTDGPRTLNGLIIEYLEDIPEAHMSFRYDDYLIEVMQLKDNIVKTARVMEDKSRKRHRARK